MTDKTKMSNLESYTELSIQIATLDKFLVDNGVTCAKNKGC